MKMQQTQKWILWNQSIDQSIKQSEGTQSQALNILCECGCVCSRSFLWIISFITWSFSFFVLFPLTNYFEMSVHTISYDYYGLLLLSLLLIIAIEYSLEMARLFQFTEFYFGQEMKYTPSMDGAMLYVNRRCNLCSNETHANFGIHHRHYKKIFLLKIKRYSRYSIWYHFMAIIGLSELQ